MKNNFIIDENTGWVKNCVHRPSENFNDRPIKVKPKLLVIHSISLPPGKYNNNFVEDFFQNKLDFSAHPYFETIKELKVSSHFFIKQSGELIQFVSCNKRAWHAGESIWNKQKNCNDFSIGIELEGRENEHFKDIQYDKLLLLIDCLKLHYKIEDIVGHSDIAPGRKTDPGVFFNWGLIKNEI